MSVQYNCANKLCCFCSKIYFINKTFVVFFLCDTISMKRNTVEKSLNKKIKKKKRKKAIQKNYCSL